MFKNAVLNGLLQLSIFDLRARAKLLDLDSRKTRERMIADILETPYYQQRTTEEERAEVMRLVYSDQQIDHIFYVQSIVE